MYNYYPPMQQQRLNYLEQQMSPSLRGRPVASLDEVRAIPIDFDGSTFYFPDAANNKIYTKQIGLNGQAVFKVYQQIDEPQPAEKTFVSKEEFDQAINELSAKISGLKQGGIEKNDKPVF